MNRHLLVDHRCDAGDRARAGDCTGDPLRVADREVAGPGGLGVRGERCVDAARRDRLVRATQCGSRRRADRLAHRVARRQRGGDDRGAEHRTGDDQRAAGRTPADVPHAEAEEHPVAQPEHGHHEQGGHESADDDGKQRCHRDAEDVAHGAGVASIVAGASRDRDVVGLAAGRRGVEGHELGDLLGVEAGRETGLGGLLGLPEA